MYVKSNICKGQPPLNRQNIRIFGMKSYSNRSKANESRSNFCKTYEKESAKEQILIGIEAKIFLKYIINHSIFVPHTAKYFAIMFKAQNQFQVDKMIPTSCTPDFRMTAMNSDILRIHALL